MIHFLKDEHGGFYWKSIRPRGFGFEDIGRSSESYARRAGCLKSILAEAENFGGLNPDKPTVIIDHTRKKPEAKLLKYINVGPEPIEVDALSWPEMRELSFVENQYNS